MPQGHHGESYGSTVMSSFCKWVACQDLPSWSCTKRFGMTTTTASQLLFGLLQLDILHYSSMQINLAWPSSSLVPRCPWVSCACYFECRSLYAEKLLTRWWTLYMDASRTIRMRDSLSWVRKKGALRCYGLAREPSVSPCIGVIDGCSIATQCSDESDLQSTNFSTTQLWFVHAPDRRIIYACLHCSGSWHATSVCSDLIYVRP